MKKLSKRQYITTLIVCFIAIAILSLCTIRVFYKKSIEDTYSLGESALEQQKEQMSSYLSRGMDVVETLAHIRKFLKVKVAFITATRDYNAIEEAKELGVEDYITKPFLPAVFLETIHGIID